MARLDIAWLVADPDFADRFDVIRTTTEVEATGRAYVTSGIFDNIVGVVSPGGSALSRSAEGERVGGDITIYTAFRLQLGSVGTTADKVRWPVGGGDIYTVRAINDWGGGFVEATCEVFAPEPAAPF